jgi:hypothetical protein
MYERMLKKEIPPTEESIQAALGPAAWGLLEELELFLNRNYQLVREMKFPFGNNYGWGYKYGHKSKHLCYAFFESGAFTVMLQLGDKEVPAMNARLGELLPKTRELWANRYPCGETGGWVHYRVLSREELADVFELIKMKKKPVAL